MMTITQIKTFAKRQLRGNKLAAAGAMILVFICTMLWCSAMFSVVFVGIIGPSTGRFVIPELARNEMNAEEKKERKSRSRESSPRVILICQPGSERSAPSGEETPPDCPGRRKIICTAGESR